MTIPKGLSFLSHLPDHFRYGAQAHPVRDWFILLVIFILAFSVSVGWNTYFFIQTVNDEPRSQEVVASEVVAIDPVTSLTTVFFDREAEATRYLNEYRFVDPSR